MLNKAKHLDSLREPMFATLSEKMKRLLLILITISNFASAFELEGTWILDKENTASFNNEHTIQTKLAQTLFACSNGQIIFTKDKLRQKSNSHQCTFNDKTTKIDGYDLEFPYKIIASDKDSIVVQTIGAENYISHGIYHIVSNDTIWMYSGGSGFMERSHVRYYYKRAK